MKKLIDIPKETVKYFNALALSEDRSVKNGIERQLIAMGDKGVSYIDLWYQCEAMSKQLKELSK